MSAPIVSTSTAPPPTPSPPHEEKEVFLKDATSGTQSALRSDKSKDSVPCEKKMYTSEEVEQLIRDARYKFVEDREFVDNLNNTPKQTFRTCSYGRTDTVIFAHSLAFPPTFGDQPEHFTVNAIIQYWSLHTLPSTSLNSFGEEVLKNIIKTDKLSNFADAVVSKELNTRITSFNMVYFQEYAQVAIDWHEAIQRGHEAAYIMKNEFSKVPLKAYIGLTHVLSDCTVHERRVLLNTLELMLGGPIQCLAQQTDVRNIKLVMEKLKLMNSVALVHQIFRSPTVKSKILGFVRLLELYDCIWTELPWVSLEKFAEFLFMAFEWIMAKTDAMKDFAEKGFEWAKCKSEDLQKWWKEKRGTGSVETEANPETYNDVKQQCSAPNRKLCSVCKSDNLFYGCSLCTMHVCADCYTRLKRVCNCPTVGEVTFLHEMDLCECDNNNDCLFRAIAAQSRVKVDLIKKNLLRAITSVGAEERYRKFVTHYESLPALDFQDFKKNVFDQLHCSNMCEVDTLLAIQIYARAAIYVVDSMTSEDGFTEVTRAVHAENSTTYYHLSFESRHYEMRMGEPEQPTSYLWGVTPFRDWPNDIMPPFKCNSPPPCVDKKNFEELIKQQKYLSNESINSCISLSASTMDTLISNATDEATLSEKEALQADLDRALKIENASRASFRTNNSTEGKPVATVFPLEHTSTEVLSPPPVTTTDPDFWELLRNLQFNEIGKIVADWFKNASRDAIIWFEENKLATGLLSIVVGIASFLGISVCGLDKHNAADNIIKRFTDASRSMYFCDRGVSTIFKNFGTVVDAAKDILGIAIDPELDEFQEQLASNLTLAQEMLNMASNNCGEFVNDSYKFLEFKKNLEVIKKSYTELVKIKNSKELAKLHPIWLSLNRVFEKLNLTYTNVMASSTARQEPVVLYFHGRTGYGKSHLMTHICNQLNKRTNRQMKIFTVSKGPDYWNGFAQQHIIRIDDMNCAIGPEGDTDSVVMFNLATSAPYNPNQAAVEDKKIMANPKFVMIGSNHMTLPMNSIMTNKQAWERRRHIMVHVDWPEHANCPENTTNCIHITDVKERNKQERCFKHLNLSLISPMTSRVYDPHAVFEEKKNTTFKPHFTSDEKTMEEMMMGTGVPVTVDNIVSLALAKEEELKETFEQSIKESMQTGTMQAASWRSPPNVLLLGAPGTGKTHILKWYDEQLPSTVARKKIVTVQDFDEWANDGFKNVKAGVVIIHDLSTLVDHPKFKDFLDRLVARYDDDKVPEDTWVMAGNEEVLSAAIIELYSTTGMERIQLIMRRCYKIFATFRPRGKALVKFIRKHFKNEKYYDENDVAAAPEFVDQYVEYKTQDDKIVTQHSVVDVLTVFKPEIKEVTTHHALKRMNTVKASAFLDVAITSDEMLRLVNAKETMKIIKLITGGKCKSYGKIQPSTIANTIFTAMKKATTLAGSVFTSIDALLVQIWNANLLEDFKGESIVLRLMDKMYCADYTGDNLECGIVLNPVAANDIIEELKDHVHTITVSDVLNSGFSILPHWLVLVGEIISTIFAISGTAIVAIESVRDQENMYLSAEYVSRIAKAVHEGSEAMKTGFVAKVEKGFAHLTGANKLIPGHKQPKMPQFSDMEIDDVLGESHDDSTSSSNLRAYKNAKREHHDGDTSSSNIKAHKINYKKEHSDSDTSSGNIKSFKANLKKEIETGKAGSAFESLKEDQTELEDYCHQNFVQGHVKTAPVLEHDVKFQCSAKSLMDAKPITACKEVLKDPATYDIVNRMLKNCVEIIDFQGNRLCSGLVVRGRCVRTVGHLLESHSIKQLRVRTMDGSIWTVEQVHHDRLVDRLDIRVTSPTFPIFADITNHFPDINYTVTEGTQALLITPDLTTLKGHVTVLVRPFTVYNQKVRHFTDGSYLCTEYRGHRYGYKVSGVNTKYGDCGSLLIITDSSVTHGKVIGMHIAANEDKAFASPLRLNHYLEKVKFQCNNPNNKVDPKFFEPVSNDEEPCLIARSKIPIHIPAKTKLFRNWIPIGPKAYEPSILSSKDTRYSGESLLRRESLKWCKQREALPAKVKNDLYECMIEVAEHYGEILRAEGVKLRKLTSTEALNKLNGSPNSEPINVHTSAGFPWNTMTKKPGKTGFIEILEDGSRRFSNKKDDLPNVSKLHSAMNDLRKQVPIGVTFQSFLKDELVKLSKIYDEPKTRTILAAPLHYVVVYKQYFHALHAAMMEHWRLHPITVGINPMSMDWHEMFAQMLEVSTAGVDLDFKGWDFSHDPYFVILMSLFYRTVYKMLDPDCTEDDQEVREHLYSYIIGFLMLVGGSLYQATGGIPSGYPGTTIDNSLINFLMAYYCWKKIMKRVAPQLANLASFLTMVRSRIYGDDILLAIEQWALKHYNGLTLAKEYTLLGFQAQSSEKGQDIVPFRPLSETTFLSRRFVRKGMIWFGPLKRDNLNKPTWYSSDRRSHHFWETPDDRIQATDIVQGVYEALLYNAALDSREVYDEFRVAACKINQMLSLPPPVSYADCIHQMYGFQKEPEELPGVDLFDFQDVLEMDWQHSIPKNHCKYSNRTSYHFGPQYTYTAGPLTNDMPKNLRRILDFTNDKLDKNFNSILVNIYPVGGKIPYHKDDEPELDLSEGVFGLTLKGDGRITFNGKGKQISCLLDPGVGYLMNEYNLTNFAHKRDEHTRPTISMTFRKVDTSKM